MLPDLMVNQEDRKQKLRVQTFKVYSELRRKMEDSILRQRKALKHSIQQYVATTIAALPESDQLVTRNVGASSAKNSSLHNTFSNHHRRRTNNSMSVATTAMSRHQTERGKMRRKQSRRTERAPEENTLLVAEDHDTNQESHLKSAFTEN